MYNLGEQFKRDFSKVTANPKSIVAGNNYRFTILNDGLIRLQYSKTGEFNDLPTELVWFRLFPVPEFTIRQDKNYLEITTKKIKLTYNKERPFKGSILNPLKNLKVDIIGTEKIWHYGHPEVRNFNAPNMGIDIVNKEATKGLYSLDGYVTIDDALHMRYDELGNLIPPLKDTVDLYLFVYGNDFLTCLKDYFALTGNPALLPRYALGNWWSKNEDYNSMKVYKLIDDFHHRKIPLSVLLLNSKWHINSYEKETDIKSGFNWDPNKFENSQEFIKYLHAKGIRLGLSIDPTKGIYPYEKYYDKIAEYLGIKDKQVIPFNALNSRFLDIYLKLVIHPLDIEGIDFFSLDIDSPSELKNLRILEHYHFHDMMRDYKRRPMVLSRNSMLAKHRYPVAYSGKTVVGWETLKTVSNYNLLSTNIGANYISHDIGGYHNGVEDNELYTRFVQLGVFSPILKLGSEKGKYYKREPWLWGIKTYSIVKDFLQLRNSLIPYLYTEAYEYYNSGKTLIEPLYYSYPDLYDDDNHKNEYFFGSAFLVSPIVNKKEHIMNRVIHKFFIPEGTWYDFFTGKKFPGGKNYVSFFKDEDYPVFAKAGSIIPFGTNEEINDTAPPKNMEIHIFPGVDNKYMLYEDDGVSDLYRKGFYLKTAIEYNYLPNNYAVIIRAVEGKSGIVPDTRNYKIRFRNTKKAEQVNVYFNKDKVSYKSYVDGSDFVVEINDMKTIGQLTINCQGKDIEIDALRIINEDISEIISDLQITTELKEKIDAALFSNLPINKKRIAIRKLKRAGLERKFIKLFLKLLEYIKQV